MVNHGCVDRRFRYENWGADGADSSEIIKRQLRCLGCTPHPRSEVPDILDISAHNPSSADTPRQSCRSLGWRWSSVQKETAILSWLRRARSVISLTFEQVECKNPWGKLRCIRSITLWSHSLDYPYSCWPIPTSSIPVSILSPRHFSFFHHQRVTLSLNDLTTTRCLPRWTTLPCATRTTSPWFTSSIWRSSTARLSPQCLPRWMIPSSITRITFPQCTGRIYRSSVTTIPPTSSSIYNFPLFDHHTIKTNSALDLDSTNCEPKFEWERQWQQARQYIYELHLRADLNSTTRTTLPMIRRQWTPGMHELSY